MSKKWTANFRLKTLSVFLVLYCVATFVLIPPIALLSGRQKITHSNNLNPANYFSVILNRNYVSPDLQEVLNRVSEHQQIRFLDANFPFIDGFPLLPHLSHNDGQKIDISFLYETQQGQIVDKTKSISGYGVFESPRPNEFNQTTDCKRKGYFQYDFPKYLSFGSINPHLQFSESGTKSLILNVLNKSIVDKMFLEPHLVSRLNVHHEKVRFHGCRAVRHDDHIHIQVKKRR
ncbi:MAG: CheY-like chemotaxis protein [Luteibaculaceae bacterium]